MNEQRDVQTEKKVCNITTTKYFILKAKIQDMYCKMCQKQRQIICIFFKSQYKAMLLS